MDFGHSETDKRLKRLEKKLTREYKAALRSSKAKLKDHMKRFEAADKEKIRMLKAGNITKDDYLKWRQGKMLTGERWKNLIQVLATDMSNANKIAIDILNGFLPDTYALNMNYGTYEIESALAMSTNFTLYDRDTVINLLRRNPKIIPRAKLNIPRDQRWNRRKLTSAITQGVLAGDSIDGIADRLQTVSNMNRNAAVRNARTYTTAAENKGRIDSYKRAKKLGIDIKQQWRATHDDRTRTSHRHLDGEIVKIGAAFSNGCKYPGDPSGRPEEIYNCRCTLVAVDPLFEAKDAEKQKYETYPNGMTYEEWLAAKPKPKKRKKS